MPPSTGFAQLRPRGRAERPPPAANSPPRPEPSPWRPAGEILTAHDSPMTALSVPYPLCEDLLYIQLHGRAPRAGPELAAVHAKAPRDGGADCVAAQHPPIAGWPPVVTVALGAGCLPLAPSGHVGAGAHSPSGRLHRRCAATSAVVRRVADGAIPPAPDPEALQDRGQGRARGASLAGASADDPGPRVLARIHRAPVGGMARSERGRGL